MPLSAGDKLGPYEILELIGKRGMGEVHRARKRLIVSPPSNLTVSGQVQSDYVRVTYRNGSASLMFFREGAVEAWSAARQIEA
jgi:hypothetical protein